MLSAFITAFGIDLAKAFGGALIASLMGLIRSNSKAKQAKKEMRELIREQRKTIDDLKEKLNSHAR